MPNTGLGLLSTQRPHEDSVPAGKCDSVTRVCLLPRAHCGFWPYLPGWLECLFYKHSSHVADCLVQNPVLFSAVLDCSPSCHSSLCRPGELRKNSPGSRHSLLQMSGTSVLAHLFTHLFIQQTFTPVCSMMGPVQDAGW